MSSTFARTFSFFKPQPTTPDTTVDSIEAGKKPDELSRKNSANHTSVANHNSDQQRPTSEDGKDLPGNLGTPASITLRKASNAYADSQAKTSMSASLVFESERDRPSDAPASELLAFYSTSTSHGKKSVSSEPLSAENVKAPQDSKIISPSDTKYTSPSRRGSKSIMQFSSSRRSSFPAETTLTFADVHLAPGTFPKSRKSSLMLEDCPRRISFVQFRSRDSVHEVIWRENERTSGSSLVSSSGTSGNPQFQSRSGTASPDCQESLTQTFGTIATVDSGILPLIPSLVKPQVNLFQWSWDKTSQSIAANAGKFGPPSDPLGQISVASASDPVLTSPRKPSNLDTPKYRRPSVPEGLYVQPFPPLRPLRAHSSTDEWRKAPLVGLNGSLASRLVPFGTQASVDENGIGGNWQNGATKETDTEGEDNNGLQTSSKFWRPSSQPRAPARLGASGTVGFNIPE